MGFIVAVGLAIPCAIHAQKVEITPFGGRQFGGALNIRTGELKVPSAWNFGAKAFMSERIAIRTEARLMFTLINAAGSIFCSSGSGCLTNVQGTGVAQLLLTAGLTFKLGR